MWLLLGITGKREVREQGLIQSLPEIGVSPLGPPGSHAAGSCPASAWMPAPGSAGPARAGAQGRRGWAAALLSPHPRLCGVCSALTSRGGRPSLGSVSAFGPGPDEVHSWFQGLYGVLLRPAWAPPAAQRRTRSPGGGLRGPGLGVAPVHVRLGPQAGGFGAAGAALPARPARSEPRGRASLC